MSQSNIQSVEGVELTEKKMNKSKSLWDHALENIFKDKMAVTSLFIVGIYALVSVLSATGIIASDWAVEVGPSYASPSTDFIFGTDIFGRSVFTKMIKGTEVAMSVGLVAALISVCIGVVLGSIAGYFGGKVDELIVWFYTCFQSIPTIMLLVALSFVLGRGLISMYVALGLTSWVNLCRLIRGEVMRHKNRDYVQAASALGGGHSRKLIKHIFPNVSHLVIINFSLMFQTAIKTEVILSYLGLGVQGRPSWGTMIDDAKLELARGVWWQLGAATLAMMIVVLSLNILGDALRDALDPKLKGK
ncbi:putative oligopeptide transport system permease protein [Halobacteriovorax marinus SJ]|uniref:Oligopeptide transport system permease protein n=1 Tax=Halobacteriovorax marinus (strain ATCC BAA-682 / DSM 15412 / SJ) TaxID=862908 RepID=E1WZ75_HALMS|nr:ABC transporter permease [Halobacteriovorax marinus]CBW27763.1 putative oligopeptide transport system permease protein [Halobacteriovorax marinus SJ]